MRQTSELTGKVYYDEDVVYYSNLSQCAFMVEHDALPINLFTRSDHKLVMVFTKADHRRVIPLWMANKPNFESGGQNG